MPGTGLILTHCRCPVVSSFISVAAAHVVVFSLVVSCSRLGCIRVDCVPSELAAIFLSLKLLYLTPHPNPGHKIGG